MNTKTVSTLIAAFVALAMIASACGGDETSGGDQAVIDAVVAALNEEGDFAGVGDIDVDCMAKAMVTGLGGAEGMEANYGLTIETINDGQNIEDVEVPRDDAISMSDGMMDCGILDIMVDEMAGDGLPEDDARCLVEKMDQDALRDSFAAEFMSDAEATAVGEAAEQKMFSSMFTAVGECDIDPASLGL